MKPKLIFLMILLIFISVYSNTIIVPLFTKEIVHISNQRPQKKVAFPSLDKTFSKAILKLTLEAPENGDGDEWDRLGSILIYDDSGQRIEIGRLVTPFWNCPWTWEIDVTDYQLLFHGDKTVEIWIESWKDDGYQATVTLELTEGNPDYLPIKITNLWNGSAVGYGNSGNTQLEKFFIPKVVKVNKNTDKSLLKFAVTGHRFTNNTGQGAEFLKKGRTVSVNGQGNWKNVLWKECGSWPVQPQDPGTWYHDRAGWCPGDLVEPWSIDITNEAPSGKESRIEYRADRYVNSGSAKDATHHVESQLIELKKNNTVAMYPLSNYSIVGFEKEGVSHHKTSYAIKNFTDKDVLWNVVKKTPWITLSSDNGTMQKGKSVVVDVNLNSTADALREGIYSDTLLFEFGQESETVVVTLEVYKRAMIGYWTFDNDSGTVARDSSRYKNHGIIEGGKSVTGKKGKALEFDRKSFVTIPPKGLRSLHDEVTICLWQYGDPAVQPSKNSIFEGAENGIRILNCHLPWENSNVSWHAGGNMIEKKATPKEFEGQWNHWAFTKNTKTGIMNIYLNGKLWTSGKDRKKKIGRADMFRIGSMVLERHGYDGIVDEFIVYNYELSAKEIEKVATIGPTPIVLGKKTVLQSGAYSVPNPVSISSTVSIVYPKNLRENIIVTIFDSNGNLIFKGRNVKKWNLTNRNGRKVSAGTYLLIVAGHDNSGVYRSYKSILGVYK